MKRFSIRMLALVLVILSLALSVASCSMPQGGGTTTTAATTAPHNHVDYVANTKLDLNDPATLKLEVTVKMLIDGDTTHFKVPYSVDATGVMKARYLAVNTPESTGKIEVWGKTASNFTKSKLESAHKIIVESDTGRWNYDGNGRYLVWIWYQPTEGAEFRCLNLELLQEGLAWGSKASECRYGESAVAAINQAKIEARYIHSKDIDPTFPYGEATQVTLKELRANIAQYDGAKVSFEGTVSYNSDWTAYVEAYDPESDLYFGIQVFYGYTSALTSVLAQGNTVRIVGVVSNFHGTYQVSGLTYNPMRPEDPANTAVISTGGTPAFPTIAPATWAGNVTFQLTEDETKTMPFVQTAMSTAISMEDLVVVDVYTTAQGASAGAMTLTCQAGGVTVDIRTEVLKDADGNLITESYFLGKTIDVKGLVEYFDLNDTGNGTYQIKLYSLSDVTVH